MEAAIFELSGATKADRVLTIVLPMHVPRSKVDKAYWGTVEHPLAPSAGDVEVYRRNLRPGSTLLLGCTRRLIELSTDQMDADPWCETPAMIVGEWTSNTRRYTNIIGDGVLNFSKQLCDGVLDMCSRHAEVLIARSFTRKLDGMRVATYFLGREDFDIAPAQVIPFEKYVFFLWQFHK